MSITKPSRAALQVKPLPPSSSSSSSSSSSLSSASDCDRPHAPSLAPAFVQIPASTPSDGASDTSDKSDEDMAEYAHARPLSVSIPRSHAFASAGPYCPPRPNLADILLNNSPPPWTLSAFMAYLSQNHCLETLEFTMDASRYRKHHAKMAARSHGGALVPGSSESAYVLSLWKKLLEAYIHPNGPREINVPAAVRDQLISHPTGDAVPDPSVLDLAVQKVYELMEESVLVPFLNSFYPVAPSDHTAASHEDLSRSCDDRSDRQYPRGGRGRSSPGPGLPPHSPTSAAPHRSSAPSGFSHFARTLSHSTRHHSKSPRASQYTSAGMYSTAVASPWSSARSESGVASPADLSAGLADDPSVSSPSVFGEPMTPPTTPSQCDFGSPASSHSGFHQAVGGKESRSLTWRNLRTSFTFRKKSGSLKDEEAVTAAHV